MFFDPNELPEDKLDALIDLTMDIFSESLSFLSELGDNMQLVRFIQQAYSSYDLAVMVDYPHPEWWPDHDMYAEAEELDAAEDQDPIEQAEMAGVYAEAEGLSAESTQAVMQAVYEAEMAKQAESEAKAESESQAQAASKHANVALAADEIEEDESEEAEVDLDDLALEDFIELSVVGTPTSEQKLEDDDGDEPTQTVLAAILFPRAYLDQVGKLSSEQMLSAIELQWLPERNTFDN